MDEQNQYQNQLQHTEMKQERNGGGKSTKVMGFMKMVAAGVIGSALTITAMPYLPETTHHVDEAAVSENTTANKSSDLGVKTLSSAKSSLADIIEEASKGVVGIVNYQNSSDFFHNTNEETEKGSGSGVVFKRQDGNAYIVTNNHVIENATKVEVSLQNGKKVQAELIGTDALTDVAVLKMADDSSVSVLPFADSSKLRAGDQVLAIGNPLGLDLSRTVTQGIVSGVNRSIEVSTSSGDWNFDVIQTDAAINPGNSGGALINTAGELVGINSLKIAESGVEGLGFAIPSNEVNTIIKEIMDHGQVMRPYLGVALADLEQLPQYYMQRLPESLTKGTIITSVEPNSSAAEAGLQIEDIIVSIGGKKVNNSTEFRKSLYTEYKIDDKVKIEFYRQGQLKSVEVTLAGNKSFE